MKKMILISLLLYYACASNAFARIVTDLYTAEVPVKARDGQALNQGLQQALTQVLIKLSGQQAQVLKPSLQAKVGNANRFVQYFEFSEETDPLILVTYFSPFAIDNLIDELGLPRWSERRPTFLGWVGLVENLPEPPTVIDAPQSTASAAPATPPAPKTLADALALDEPDTPVESAVEVDSVPVVDIADSLTPPAISGLIINEIEHPEAAQLLKTYSTRRGLPMILPVLDLDDQRTLSLQQLQDGERNAILAAAARYGAKAILSGWLTMQQRPATAEELTALAAAETAVATTHTPEVAGDDENPAADGYEEVLVEEWRGHWHLYVGNQPFSWEHQAKSLAGLLAATVDKAVNHVAQVSKQHPDKLFTQPLPTAAVQPVETSDTFQLHVTNVPNLQDYIRVQAYLKRLEIVESLTMKAIRVGEVHFKLTVAGGNVAFANAVANSQALIPLPDAQLRGTDIAVYRFIE